ncbi:peptidase C15, pyroglutamyl peptidase I-like protein [Choiromyces venosus 120613-1]|uniref:Peptidase C15, pyroglutamyl peptidase I-like protein n=1 Tax=Choiromyces venosus 120613-1 TaxID=1336337 RepID=A0A3N4JZG7_9PEZI|nr:peptidase C15, pyroglutamyl peptidase I-like protein [Choiromyces venosus 120613-1]
MSAEPSPAPPPSASPPPVSPLTPPPKTNNVPPPETSEEGSEAPSTTDDGSPLKKIIRVWVTGFGPFRNHNANSSWAIVNSFKPQATIMTDTCKIILLPHPNHLRVSYHAVRTQIPPLHAISPHIFDYMLHVGLGAPGEYRLERRAFEEGYMYGDVDNRLVNDEDAPPNRDIFLSEGVKEREPGGREFSCGLDLEWIVGQVEKPVETEKLPIKVSDDAGRFLCEYLYYSSLKAACDKEGKDRLRSEKVLFMHVPSLGEPFGVETGRKVLVELVKAMVAAGEEKRFVD